MTESTNALSSEELEDEQATDLPERDTLSVVDGGVVAPLNPVSAVNLLNDDATTNAFATQNLPITQTS